MNIEFEHKYYVLKIADMALYLAPDERSAIFTAMERISLGREKDGKGANTYLVVNTDEPYAGQVAQIMKSHGHFTPGGDIVVKTSKESVAEEYCPFCGCRTEHANKPLTLDELRQMDGKPVWIQEGSAGHWELSVDAADYLEDRDLDFYGMIAWDGGLHQLGWLAYRCKSE